MFYVYVFMDPRKPGKFRYGRLVFAFEPFYVGKGNGTGWRDHLKAARDKEMSPKSKRIRSIWRAGEEPMLRRFDGLSEEEAYARESKLIGAIGRSDLKLGPLTNRSRGGGGYRAATTACLRERKAAKSKALKNRWSDPKARKRQSEALRAAWARKSEAEMAAFKKKMRSLNDWEQMPEGERKRRSKLISQNAGWAQRDPVIAAAKGKKVSASLKEFFKTKQGKAQLARASAAGHAARWGYKEGGT